MMQIGSSGEYVRMWQDLLASLGHNAGTPDGIFGKNTFAATKAFQAARGVYPDGKVGAGTFREAVKAGWPQPEGYPLIPSKYFTTSARVLGDVDWVVIHTMEVPEKSYMAEEISMRFADKNSKEASTHFCVDDDTVVQNVLLKDIAWHASKGNRRGIGIEHAGYSSQFPDDWSDEFTTRMLDVSAKLTAKLCRDWGLPVVWLDGDQVRAGEKGITGHKQVNDAFHGGRGHHDPGPNFPTSYYLDLVRSYTKGC